MEIEFMTNEEKEKRELSNNIFEMITGNIYFYIEQDINSWSTDEVKRAIAYTDSDDFTDDNFFIELMYLVGTVVDDIKTQM